MHPVMHMGCKDSQQHTTQVICLWCWNNFYMTENVKYLHWYYFHTKPLANYIAEFIVVPTKIYNRTHTNFTGMIRTTVNKHLSSVLWNTPLKKIIWNPPLLRATYKSLDTQALTKLIIGFILSSEVTPCFANITEHFMRFSFVANIFISCVLLTTEKKT